MAEKKNTEYKKMLQVKEETHKRVKQGAVMEGITIDAYLKKLIDLAEGKA